MTRRTPAQLAAFHRAELERLTGKLVRLVDRAKYNAAAAARMKRRYKPRKAKADPLNKGGLEIKTNYTWPDRPI